MSSHPAWVLCREIRLSWEAERSRSSARLRTSYTQKERQRERHNIWMTIIMFGPYEVYFLCYCYSSIFYPPCLWCVVFPVGIAVLQQPDLRHWLHSQSPLRGKTSAPPVAQHSDQAARNPGMALPRRCSASTRQQPEKPRRWGEGGQRPPCPGGLHGHTI